ncbi:MAG TPA: endo-1,3-alpha-glucanase family glycosylhydrolase [Capsulimonadaceae bacterium]|jgi:hypothetical protein
MKLSTTAVACLACATFSVLLLISGGKANAADLAKRAVFANYMVCYCTYGETLEGYKREIVEAQAAGIDGFAVNIGSWYNEPYYIRRTNLLFQAAQELGTGFKYILSLDLATLKPEHIRDIVKAYAKHPNHYQYNGRPLVTTFDGGSVDWKSILRPLKAEGYDLCFVPFFYPNPVTELPSYDAVKAHFARYNDFCDGYFFFGAAGTADELTAGNAAYNRAAREDGKLVMASYTPYYWGSNQPGRRYFETQGGVGTEKQWKSIIAMQPDFVHIVTWNDFAETYLAPVDDAGKYDSGLRHPVRHPHAAYYEMLKYFIPWYKTGKEPKIEHDGLFYFYRVHPKAAIVKSTTTDAAAKPVSIRSQPATDFHGPIADSVYVSTLLTAPAEIRIKSGGVEVKFQGGKGFNNFETPFHAGDQQFSLYRNGKLLAETTGEAIVAEPTEYDFFPTTGFVYAK